MAAGGAAILDFGDHDLARAFTAAYTRQVINEAPGLVVAVAHRPYRPGELAQALLALHIDLARAELEVEAPAPLLGLGVTASCRVTGRPATDVGGIGPGPQVPISALTYRARRQVERSAGQGRWSFLLNRVELPVQAAAARFPTDLDEMGRSAGERSLMGVVHVDGNGVGSRITRWLRECAAHSMLDAEVARAYRAWSVDLSQLAREAMEAVVRRVGAALVVKGGSDDDVWMGGQVENLHFKLVHEERDKVREVFLPLRPILVGGDDLTFVCDGRIALDLAATAVAAFGRKVEGLGDDPVAASAGVAIVKTHTPFVRAYELAASLCVSAKREVADGGPRWQGGAIDWHLGAFRPGESVESIRHRHAVAAESPSGSNEAGMSPLEPVAGAAPDMTCRPYRMGAGEGDVRSWQWLNDELLGTGPRGLRGPLWAERRGNVKVLARLAREGERTIKRMLETWQVSEADLQLPAEIEFGFSEGRTPLIEASELLDRAQVLA
jgi:hypothetical protein